MYRKKPSSIGGVQHYLWFQASTGDVWAIPAMDKGDYFTSKPGFNHFKT